MKKPSIKSKPFLIGITGGIGSGKTTVASFLNVLGIPVFNADLEAREVINTDPELRRDIEAIFGKEAYTSEGLNRPLIAGKVFADKGLRQKLNDLVHPAVGRAFDLWVEKHRSAPFLAKEAAIMIEAGTHQQMDFVILVTAPKELRARRAMMRDSISSQDVLKRMEAQMTDEEKMPYADFVVVNDDHTAVIPQLLEIYMQLKSNRPA